MQYKLEVLIEVPNLERAEQVAEFVYATLVMENVEHNGLAVFQADLDESGKDDTNAG